MSDSGQKFIGRNRAPRVQIEYDLETGGAQRKVSLPFVMGVMSDLKGHYGEGEEPSAIEERDFEEVSSATFDKYLKDMKPRMKFDVANRLSAPDDPDAPESLHIDMDIQSMKDFTPARIAEKVPALKELLDARNQLKTLMSYMDGKPNAEKLIADLLSDDKEALLQSLKNAKAAETADKPEG